MYRQPNLVFARPPPGMYPVVSRSTPSLSSPPPSGNIVTSHSSATISGRVLPSGSGSKIIATPPSMSAPSMVSMATARVLPTPSTQTLSSSLPILATTSIVVADTPQINDLHKNPNVNMTPVIVGSVIGGVTLLCLCVLSGWCCWVRQKRRRRRLAQDRLHSSMVGSNRSWSTLGSSTSSAWDQKPPMYMSSDSIVKQPPPAYPHPLSDSSNISPTNTLVDTSVLASTHLPKEHDSLASYSYSSDLFSQPRRSIQPYQAQLNLSASSPFLADDLEPPGPYETGILFTP
ncbi:hypothetical protein DM01DRAFT_359563 [Hesseltinella vesiculosa]|uniref:Uncharacterized protein n=1 Tax=Hesseltinella vesiculosa TaxID=101127 RepID=A0A1X2GIF7_9FUNG|nr:hypothetical protein DM01DRAFT_359563 [Hesseltinella vesiculosa]